MKPDRHTPPWVGISPSSSSSSEKRPAPGPHQNKRCRRETTLLWHSRSFWPFLALASPLFDPSWLLLAPSFLLLLLLSPLIIQRGKDRKSIYQGIPISTSEHRLGPAPASFHARLCVYNKNVREWATYHIRSMLVNIVLPITSGR